MVSFLTPHTYTPEQTWLASPGLKCSTSEIGWGGVLFNNPNLFCSSCLCTQFQFRNWEPGLKFTSSGFLFLILGIRDSGFGIRDLGLGFRVTGSGFRGSKFSVFGIPGLGFEVTVSGFGFRVSGFGFRVLGYRQVVWFRHGCGGGSARHQRCSRGGRERGERGGGGEAHGEVQR